MSPEMPNPSPVSPEQALAELTEWQRDETRGVAELAGPPDSGRTRTLRRLNEAAPNAIFLDATGLTSEDLIAEVMGAAGLDMPDERRADWGHALRKSSFAGNLVVIANAQRAGRTRRSSEPDRMVHRFAVDLAVAGQVKVLIERDLPDVRRWHRNRVVTLQSARKTTAPENQLGDAATEALRALALAEVRHVPLTVWRALARALESQTGRPVDVTTALQAASNLLEADADDRISFSDERIAEAFRRSTEPEVLHAVNVAFVEWLRSQPPSDATGRYLAQGLAMHAVQAGQFDSVQRSGRLAAHLDQVALIDAAHCEDGYRIDYDSPAGDAVNLWMSGVDSLPQGEWASWLHLMSTVRGDQETAADIAASGQQLPWRVRWAHWRPPGGMSAAFIRPGPLSGLTIAPDDYCPGRTAVVARGDWDRRYRVWDADSGEALAGPWPGSVPAPGMHEPLWLPDTDRDVTPTWVDLTEYDSLGAAFVSAQVTAGALTVVTGLGGIFAVESPDSEEAPVLSRVHGEPMFDDGNFACALQDRTAPPRGTYDPDLFEPGVVRRLPAERLPDGLTDAEARRFLTVVGLPAFEGVEMMLGALDEHGLPQLDTESLPAGVLQGTYYKLGVWGGGEVVLHGSTGRVFLLSEGLSSNADYDYDDEDEEEFEDLEDDGLDEEGNSEEGGGQTELIASSLASFIDLLQHYAVSRCMLASAGSRHEREAIRNDLELSLSSIDEPGTASGTWMADFQETD